MADKIVDRLVKAIESLADLRVATIVGDVEITIADNKPVLAKTPGGDAPKYPGALTTIDLVAGDIVNSVASEYYENPTFMSFHKEQLETARKIVETNVSTVTELAKSAGQSLMQLLSQDSTRS